MQTKDTKLRQTILRMAGRYSTPGSRSWLDGMIKKSRLDRMMNTLIIRKLQGKVRNSAIGVVMRVKTVQTFFKICVLKKLQAGLYVQWRLDAHTLKVYANGNLPSSLQEIHLARSLELLQESVEANNELIAKEVRIMQTRLCLCSEGICNVLASGDHRVGSDLITAQTIPFRSPAQELSEKKKIKEGTGPLMAVTDYLLTSKEKTSCYGIRMLKSAYLPHTHHGRLSLLAKLFTLDVSHNLKLPLQILLSTLPHTQQVQLELQAKAEAVDHALLNIEKEFRDSYHGYLVELRGFALSNEYKVRELRVK